MNNKKNTDFATYGTFRAAGGDILKKELEKNGIPVKMFYPGKNISRDFYGGAQFTAYQLMIRVCDFELAEKVREKFNIEAIRIGEKMPLPKTYKWAEMRIKIIKGDIVKVKAEAIVNAANKTLLGGGGVDGAIHRAAGEKLFQQCKRLGGCKTGEAKITKGYNLDVKYIIHTVGPVWQGGGYKENEELANCYINSLRLASENKIKSIAFPSISTGAYGFPVERAAVIALEEVKRFLKRDKMMKEVIFVLFSEKDLQIYQNLI